MGFDHRLRNYTFCDIRFINQTTISTKKKY